MTPQEAINAQVARIVAVNDALYRALATDGGAEWAERVDTWHRQALLWIDLGNKVAAAPTRAGEWSRLGDKLAATAGDIGAAMADDTVTARVRDFAAGMPGALRATLNAAKDAVKAGADAAADAASSVLWAALRAVPWPVYALAGVAVVAAGYAIFSGRAESLVKAVRV